MHIVLAAILIGGSVKVPILLAVAQHLWMGGGLQPAVNPTPSLILLFFYSYE